MSEVKKKRGVTVGVRIYCQGMCKQKGGILARAQDLASVTQGEHCALHLMHVPDLLDRRLATFSSKGGET